MAITKANILTAVKARTGRTELTDIDTELEGILRDLSSRWPFLEKVDATLTLTINVANMDLPADFRGVSAVKMTVTGAKLTPQTFGQLTALLSANSTSGVPTRYAIFNDDLYVYPAPSSALGVTMYYSYETGDSDSIPFADCFREAITQGVCFKIYEGKSLLGEVAAADMHLKLYEQQIDVLKARYANRQVEG